MTLFDVDKGSVDRGSPDPNRVDQVIDGAVKAHGTISVSPVTNATTSTDQLATQFGTIHLGQATYNTGIGFWMGLDTDDIAKFSIGDSGSHSLTWDGSALDIVGSFTATSGSITGGFTIGTGGSLSSGQTAYNTGTGFWLEYNGGTPRFSLGDSSGDNLTWDGSALDITGSLTATSGTIGGWSIGSSALTSGSGSNSVGLDSGGTNPAFYAGSATPGSAPFRVTQAGALTATSATIMGSITSTSGTIGGFTIGSTSLTAGSGSTTIGLDSGGTNPAFYAGSATPGSAPFRVTDAGALTATSGTIGGFTIGSSALYGSTIKTAATVDGTHNGVIMDTSGLRGYSSTLGEVFNLPTDGSAPSFSSGTIDSTTFNIDTSAALKTSTNALSGAGGDAGVLINNSGIFAGSAGQSTSTANVQLKSDGTFSLYSNSSDAMTLDHGSNLLLKEGGHIDFTTVSDAGVLTPTLVATSTGNIDNGAHVYYVTFVNAGGETSPSNISSTVTIDSSHKQVSLTNIPISSSGAVTARKIYRTKAGVTTYPCYLLTTISDNTTTTYTDNTADASLGASNPNPSDAPLTNSSSGYLSVNGTEVLHLVDGGGLGSWLEVSVNEFNISLSVIGDTTRDINFVPSTSSNTVQVNSDTITTNTAPQTLTNKDLTSSTNSFYHIAFRAYQSGTQSVTTGADRLIQFDSTNYNIGSAYTGASTYEFTAPVAGIYSFAARAGATGTATSSRVYMSFYVNGSEHTRGSEEPNTAGYAPTSMVTADIKLAASDTVQVYFRTVNANLTIGNGDAYGYFTGHYICPAT